VTPRPAPHIIRWFLCTTGYAGICLPPVGIYILAEHLYSDRLIRHERAHWAQWQRMGTIRLLQRMDKKIDKMERQLEDLVALANKGKGGFWMGMTIASFVGGAASWLASHWGGKSV
jgi:hypothetical protein